MKREFSVFTGLLLFSFSCIAQLRGKVVAIADGDTFTLLTEEKKQIRIRLHGIDCPEKNQDYGTKAKQFTSDLVFGTVVEVIETDVDRYGRTIGIVKLPNGNVLNEELLKAGLAWHYRRYDTNPAWEKMEQEARRRKIGLWSLPNPVEPEQFRHGRK